VILAYLNTLQSGDSALGVYYLNVDGGEETKKMYDTTDNKL
jgi:hypothetical protein